MARYTYNKSLVNEALDELYSACDAIENTNVDIEKGISTILNARGAENLGIDFTVITNYQSQVIEYIESIGADIKKKQEEIEEYESASGLTKFWSTFAMGGLKLFEGIITIGEQLVDGVVSIVGFVGGLFNSDFQDSCAEFVKKDHIGDAFSNAYETGWLQDVNKYSIMSHQSTAANVLKGVGTAVGYIAIGIATGGTGTAALATSATLAGVAGIGSGTQSGLQQGMEFNQAFGQGVKQGVVAAGTTLVAAGIANKLGAAGKVAANAGDELGTAAAKVTETVPAEIIDSSGKVLTTIKNGATISDEMTTALTTTTKGAVSTTSNIASSGAKAATAATAKTSQGILKTVGNVGKNLVKGTVKLATSHPKTTVALATGINLKQQMDNINTSNAYRQATMQAGVTTNNQSDTVSNDQTTDTSTTTTPTIADETFQHETTPDATIENNQTTPTNTTTSTGGTQTTTSTTGNTTTTTSTPTYKVEAEEVTLPSTNTTTDTSSTTDTTSTNTNAETNTNTSTSTSTDDIVSSVSLGNNSNVSTSGHTATGGSYGAEALVEESGLDETSTDVTLEEDSLLNATGNVSGSLSGLTSGNSVNIPTSSSPLISTNKTSGGNSVIPLAAGLGAASIAGLGTKVVLDKKENKDNEETDEVTAEEWSGEDTFEVDYEESDGSDYLSPTDEYAYQEEPQESYQAINSSELASMQ